MIFVTLVLSLFGVDSCHLKTLYIADPDRTMCQVDWAGPFPPGELPPDLR